MKIQSVQIQNLNRPCTLFLNYLFIFAMSKFKILIIMSKFIEFWVCSTPHWKRMIINTAHIVWFENQDGKAVLYLSSNPDEPLKTDHPFNCLYEELTGLECPDDFPG